MKAINLLKDSKIIRLLGDYNQNIEGLSFNSKTVQQGDLFFCIKGSNIDGHNYAKEAVKNGAKLLIVERELDINCPQVIVHSCREEMGKIASNFYNNPRQNFTLIGITGTNGKTSSTYILQSVFSNAGNKVGVIGTIGIVIDNKKYDTNLTTPDPIELHRIFSLMAKAGVNIVVMEVSAHAIALDKMAGVQCDIGVLTNVTQDHLDFFKSFDNYKNVKKSFISPKFCKHAVINIDDEVGNQLAIKYKNQGFITTFSLKKLADYNASKIHYSAQNTKYVVQSDKDFALIKTPLLGEFNVYNGLGAIAVAGKLGIYFSSISKGLTNIKAIPGRFNVEQLPGGGTVIIDYAHTPDGLKNILSSVRQFTTGNLLSVFGCGGNRDSGKRLIMGGISEELADYTIITSDNPRFENPEQIIKDIEKGFIQPIKKYICITDRKKAIEYAMSKLYQGDVLVISGKGAENYIDINGTKYPYSDLEVVKNYQLEGKKEAVK